MIRRTSDEPEPEHRVHHGPWRAFVSVRQIPERGLHREIEADPATRESLAKAAGVRELLSARGSFDLKPGRGGQVRVTGRVQAKVAQTCVVTLDPIENDIDERVELIFQPSEPAAEFADGDSEIEIEMDDQPEPIENGMIDLGRLATEVLYLAIDPYPRKPGAVFEPRVATADPDDHPFAGLKRLQPGSDEDASKPKRK